MVMPTQASPPQAAPATTEPAATPVPGPAAIETTGLTKVYGGRTVVDHLDLRLPAGVVAGFVGPNGAGKSTTLRMLLGLVRPSSGAGTVLGVPLERPGDYLPRVGALIEAPAFYPALSGRANLRVLATLSGVEEGQVLNVLETVGLTARADDRYRAYSLGMKQRLGIAAALLTDPDLLILDEPTNGLDPQGIIEMRELIRAIADDGPTVLVSSHLLSEVQQVCDWLLMVEAGRQVYQGRTADLLAGGSRLRLRGEHAADLPALADLLRRRGLEPERDGAALLLPDGTIGDGEVAAISREAAGAGITLVELARTAASLEERYGALVAGGVR
jgi:ABC-2 type transport system ATP-binding protein